MKNVLYLFGTIALASLLMAGNCKKSGGGNNEPSLSVELNPAAGSNQAPAPGPDFPLAITIKSTLPTSGVKIDVTAKQDVAGSTSFYTESRNSTTAANNFSITNSPRNVTIRVDVVVTSLSNSSNKWTGSYTYSRK